MRPVNKRLERREKKKKPKPDGVRTNTNKP
jgi:hypothetical protein